VLLFGVCHRRLSSSVTLHSGL